MTPGHATAKFLNRTVACPCCDGLGYYVAGHSSNGFDVDQERRYTCTECTQGRLNWLEYKRHYAPFFGPARRS